MPDNTRYCPTCNDTDLIVGELAIQCKRCERILEVRIDGLTRVVDKAWAESEKQS